VGTQVDQATTQANSAPAIGRSPAQAAAETGRPTGPSARVPPHIARGDLIALQHRIGNRAVGRLLAASQQHPRPVPVSQVLARDAPGATATPATAPLPDGIKCNSCSNDQAAQIGAAHQRAKQLARNAIDKLIVYDGKSAGDVRDALSRNFHDTSKGTARAVASALLQVMRSASGTSYVCKAKANGSNEAMALWCLPFTDIRVYPLFYSSTELNYRASTLLHEWMHRYHCDLDLGYSYDPDYASHSKSRQFWNADAYSTLAYEIGQPEIGDFDSPPPSDSGVG
jgi:hypothetical protein